MTDEFSIQFIEDPEAKVEQVRESDFRVDSSRYVSLARNERVQVVVHADDDPEKIIMVIGIGGLRAIVHDPELERLSDAMEEQSGTIDRNAWLR